MLFLPPFSTLMMSMNSNGVPMVSQMGPHIVMASNPNLQHSGVNGATILSYPSQPLPPVPAPQQPMSNGFHRNLSTDSFLHKAPEPDQMSSSGRGTDSSGRPVTPPLKTSRPVTPVQQQPLGLPVNRAKLVPGRMSNSKLDSSRPGSRREISSTAV